MRPTDIDERARVAAASQQLAAAIERRDVAAIRALLAPGFIHRTHGGAAVERDDFLRAIEEIPGRIVFVRLEQLQVDITAAGALVTGIQHAQLRVGAETIDDRRGFVDWFISVAGEWRIQAAVDLPAPHTD